MGSAAAITGAAGFLGRHLVEAFTRRGMKVVPVTRQNMDAFLADLPPLDVIVHAAAVRHRHGVGAADYRASNVELVEKLLRAAQGKVKRFVYVSSVGVYGFPDHLPITEETPFAPVTLYSATKVEAEKLVRTLSPQLGVEWVIARPTIIYGKGDDNGMLDKMVRMIRAGSYRIVGGGKNTLHHTHVDDIVQGIWLCATAARAAGDDFILAGPETTTLEGLSSIVAARAGEKLPRLKIPLGFARAVATVIDVAAYRGLVFDKKEPPINHEKLDVMCRSIAFDPGKAKRLLGYAPAVGYVEGVKKTLE